MQPQRLLEASRQVRSLAPQPRRPTWPTELAAAAEMRGPVLVLVVVALVAAVVQQLRSHRPEWPTELAAAAAVAVVVRRPVLVAAVAQLIVDAALRAALLV